jgi:hypothetical protein
MAEAERVAAVALVLLGQSVADLGGGLWSNPLRAGPPPLNLIDALAPLLNRHRRRDSPWCRAHQIVVAAVLKWDGFRLPSGCDAWRTAATQLIEFIVQTTVLARIQWLRQLDQYLANFNQHPILVGQKRGFAGIDRIVRRVLRRFLDQPPCEHWRLHRGVPRAAAVQLQVGDKDRQMTAMINGTEEFVEQARAARLEAAAKILEEALAKLRVLRRKGRYFNDYERAFVTCRRAHSLKHWSPDSETVVLEPPTEGARKPLESEILADLWVFVVRAVSGVPSWFEYVMSTALTANVGVLSANRIFRYWEKRAQAFAGSLFFHALNSRGEVIRWDQVVHWQCTESRCQDWKSDRCPKPPKGCVRCHFAPTPSATAIIRYKFVRRDHIGTNGTPYTVVPVWLCHNDKHTIAFPLPGAQPGDEPQMGQGKAQVVYAESLTKCPLPGCEKPHSSRTAKVLVEIQYLANII